MLDVGVPLLGVGKLMLVGGSHIILSPPESGRRYFLTTSGRHELAASLKSVARTLNFARWVFGLAGLAAVAYIIYRAMKNYRSHCKSQQMLAELRNRRQATPSDVEMAAACVICLHQRREVVLLDCGHICLCGDCAAALPLPKLCPICRRHVDRIIPTYVS